MFLKGYTDVSVGFDEVVAALSRGPYTWLDGVADAVERDGNRLLVEVGLEVRGREIGRKARLEVGNPVTWDRVMSLPLKLQVQDHGSLFPSLDGSLDAAWLGPGRTHLALTAQYEPPLGLLGRAIDRALLHRVAEAVAHHFLDTVAGRLAAESAGRRDGTAMTNSCS